VGGETQQTSRPVTPATALQRIERHALASEIMRVRAVLLVAWATWVLGIGFDFLTLHLIGAGPLWLVLVTRLTSLAFHAYVAWHLFKGGIATPRLTRALIIVTFPVSVFAQSLLAAALGGVTSPYVGGVFVVLICQAAAVTMPWKRGVMLSSVSTWMFPLGMLVGYAVCPELRAQLADPPLRNLFILEVMVVFSAGTVTAWASHGIWTLRQGLVESKSVGRYRLLRRIGKGGMGEVWHAHDRATRRDVALKILAPRMEDTDPRDTRAAVDRFEREIETTARLDHPNVVRIFDWGATDDGIWYYAMELLDGVDLSTLIKSQGPLPARAVVEIGLQAARALGVAHAAGIVHRDIKPANLFVVDRQGTFDIKVLDFGIARVEGDDGMTRTGALIGTPAFMPPEAMSGNIANRASDVWSLGATLSFAATGVLPSEASTIVVVPELAGVIAAAMAKDPGARPADGNALASLLASLELARAPSLPAVRLPSRIAVDVDAPTVAPDP
jgi:eukaryotic-like serine/threonine-protein kinase